MRQSSNACRKSVGNNAMQCNAMQCNAMQCNAMQCNECNECNAAVVSESTHVGFWTITYAIPLPRATTSRPVFCGARVSVRPRWTTSSLASASGSANQSRTRISFETVSHKRGSRQQLSTQSKLGPRTPLWQAFDQHCVGRLSKFEPGQVYREGNLADRYRAANT
jgi:hypothetical protein